MAFADLEARAPGHPAQLKFKVTKEGQRRLTILADMEHIDNNNLNYLVR